MKRVLFATNNMNGGGAEKILLNILNYFDRTKYSIDLLLVFKQGVYIDDVPEDIHTDYIFETKTKEAEDLIKYNAEELCKKYVKDSYDVQIAFLEGNATKILSYAHSKYTKKFAWVHINLKERHYTSASYVSLQEEIDCYEKYNKIAFVSKAAQSAFLDFFGNSFANKSVVLYNPINVSTIRKKADEYSINTDSLFNICASGRLTTQKGFDRLIEVAARLIQNGYQFKLNILGDGARKGELQKMIRNYRLENCVSLLGFHRNPYPFMKASDLFVCSSRTEGYCLVVCEALSLNIPVVSTDCTGIREALCDGRYGEIVDNSVDGLYRGIAKCIENPAYLSDLRKKAQLGQNSFNYEQRMKIIEDFIDQ